MILLLRIYVVMERKRRMNWSDSNIEIHSRLEVKIQSEDLQSSLYHVDHACRLQSELQSEW